jgi:DNA-binding MarR family transcriptional regulator
VLTDAGARMLTDVEQVVADIENRMFATLGSDERSTLYTLLQRAAAAASGGPEAPAADPD